MTKNLLIVGASGGIGAQLHNQLKETYHIITAGRTPLQGNHIAFDALDSSLKTELLPEVLHGIVYCPGTINLKPFHRIKTEDFEHDFKVNVLGAIKVVQACLPNLKKAEQASIVMFSTVAVKLGMGFHSSIAASKGAVEGLAKSLAAELAPKIRCNVIAPSLTNTPLAEKLLNSPEKELAGANRHPLKRVGTVNDMANACSYLLSDNSSWVTGQVLAVDGGMSAVKMI